MNNKEKRGFGLIYLILIVVLLITITSCNSKTSITGFAVLDENTTNETITTETTTTDTTINQTTSTTNETIAINETKEKEKPVETPAKEEKPKPAEPNKPPVWKSDVNEFIVKGKTTIDLNNYFVDENNDTITYTSTTPEKISVEILNNLAILTPTASNFTTTITFTATDGDKTTSKEVTLIVPERSIAINLQYKLGTSYDADDNGYEATYGIIDLTVENSQFAWDVNETNLCTRWEVYSIENEELTTVCYGDLKCCSFIGLGTTRDKWNEPFYSTFGQYGATLNNIVSAQILYVDYGTRENKPYVEIYNSPWQNLSVNYYVALIEFENVCVETCILTGFNETSYKLIFEVDGATLTLDKLTYSLIEEISNVLFDLAIKDAQGLISGNYTLYKNNNIISIVEGFVEPDYYNIEVVPTENVIDKLVIENTNITKPTTATIGVDNVTKEISIENVDVKKRYAVNLEELEFEKATLTATASANALYKCKQWDYERELCFGSWEKVKDLVVGEAYSITLTKEDPGFIEGNVNITIVPINITGLALIKDIPNITITINKNATFDLSEYFANIDENTVFTYFKQEGISILFENNIATIIPNKDFIGTVYTYITATKGSDTTISNLFSVNVVNVTITNITIIDITPKIIIDRKNFGLDEDVDLEFEYLDKEELIEHNKWKEEYEVYEEETEKTEEELRILEQKIIKK